MQVDLGNMLTSLLTEWLPDGVLPSSGEATTQTDDFQHILAQLEALVVDGEGRDAGAAVSFRMTPPLQVGARAAEEVTESTESSVTPPEVLSLLLQVFRSEPSGDPVEGNKLLLRLESDTGGKLESLLRNLEEGDALSRPELPAVLASFLAQLPPYPENTVRLESSFAEAMERGGRDGRDPLASTLALAGTKSEAESLERKDLPTRPTRVDAVPMAPFTMEGIRDAMRKPTPVLFPAELPLEAPPESEKGAFGDMNGPNGEAPPSRPDLQLHAVGTKEAPETLVREVRSHPAGGETPRSAVVDVERPLGHPQWPEHLGERLLWLREQSFQRAELHIHPRHLGPVEVQIRISEDQAAIHFASPHAAVREALEAALPRLREMFAAQQLQLNHVDVQSHLGNGQSGASQQEGESRQAWFASDDLSQGEDSASGTQTIRPASGGDRLLSLYA